jgi:ABC-2 type transport system ATP-binding protein
MNAEPDAICCQGLSRRYGNFEALKPLDLRIPGGAVFGFLGRNGAGKTTTIRLLTGLARPTAGSAWVAGVEVTAANDNGRTHFGYLPEEPAFYTWMTPREYLDYVGRIFGLAARERRQRIERLLEQVGLAASAGRRITGFSRGMRQRLGLAQALINRPPVLFLDEPASALDPAGRREVLDLIAGLRAADSQTTVFLSSHILADVEEVCDTVAIIREGELVLVAGRDELMARYAADVVVLAIDPVDLPLPAAFMTAVNNQPWVNSLTAEGATLRLKVNDIEQGKSALLPLVVEHGLHLERYEWVRPSLEEIFLGLSQ